MIEYENKIEMKMKWKEKNDYIRCEMLKEIYKCKLNAHSFIKSIDWKALESNPNENSIESNC